MQISMYSFDLLEFGVIYNVALKTSTCNIHHIATLIVAAYTEKIPSPN